MPWCRPQMLDTQEKVAHLLRRFGLGASYHEVQSYSKLGVDGALTRLIHYEGIPEDFNVSPWSYAFDNSKEKVSLNNNRFVAYWATKMLLTNRPLQENLTLFWHNHFAVSGSKIEYAPLMLGYMELLRANASGTFRDLLGNVARDPAMVKWLDSDTNIKGKPNENFGREVMELFTLGVGNYTETDVKEGARAFTGWSTRNSVNFPRGTKQLEQVTMNLEADRPMVCFSDSPALHDDGFKTFLGKRGNYNADHIFDILVEHPAHAPFIMKKMWEWFAYPNPEPKVLEALCKVYADSKYDIKHVLRYIGTCDEFWSDKCIRAVVKSPVAYTISIGRQLNLGPMLAQKCNMNAAQTQPVDGPLLAWGYFLANVMQKQGLQLLYPPDVSGWRWGTHWITSASMMERVQLSDYLFRQRQGQIVPHLWQQINEAYKPQNTEQVVDAIISWFDCPATPDDRKVLIDAANEAGGMAAFAKAGTSAKVFSSVFRLVASIPQYQMT